MKQRITLLLLITFIICKTYAQNTLTDSLHKQNLNEVLVTTKLNLTNINTARTVETISADRQKSNGSNSMYGLLNTASGVYMVDMGNEQHAMSIRLPMGYDPLYNYLENGIPLRPTGIFNNNELLELNRFSIQKTEIIKGPFSGGYGAQSIGASINFIQKNVNASANELSFQSNGYGHWETQVQAKTNVGKWKAAVNFNNAQRRVDEDLHFNYTKQAFSLRLEKAVNANNEIVFQHNLINYNGDQRDGYNSDNFYNRNYTSYDKFSDRNTLAIRNSLQWKHNNGKGNILNFTLFNRVITERQTPFYLVSYVSTTMPNGDIIAPGQKTKDQFTSYGLSIDHSKTSRDNKFTFNQSLFFDFTPDNRYTSDSIVVHKSSTGVNLKYDNTGNLVTHYKANLKNIAVSMSVNYAATNKLKLYAGVRADLLTYTFTNYLISGDNMGSPSGNNSFFSINPEASVLYKINQKQSVFAQFSTGFTPPTLSKMYRGVKTPTLTPARYFNTEIGYKFSHKHGFVQISLYNMNGTDEFTNVLRPTGVEVVNAGQTNHKGIELQLYFNKDNFEFTYNPSLAKHTFIHYSDVDYMGNVLVYNGNAINSAPGYLHYANVAYRFTKFHQLKLIAEWNKVGPYQINAANTSEYEGYDLFNFKTTLSIGKFFINMGVNNVFDKTYATNADATYGLRYYPGLPRTFQAGISWKW